MHYGNQFKRFNPFKGVVPDNPFLQHLNDIVVRARKILRGRTAGELHQAAKAVDWMIDCCVEPCGDEANSLGIKLSDLRDHYGDAYWFKEGYGGYDYSEFDGFKEGKAYEFFAVLALWKAIDALEYCGKLLPKSPHASISTSLAGACSIQAMEAICEAECLERFDGWRKKIKIAAEPTDEAIQKKVSLAKEMAAVMGHATHYGQQLTAIQLFLEKHQNKSVQQAASIIAPVVNSTQKTVAKWLYAHKKKEKNS